MKNGIDASHLPDPSQVNSEDTAVEAYSQVLKCVHRANGELAKPKDTKPGYDGQDDQDNLSEHLTEWLVALHRLMKVIVHYIPHVDTYSFTFGTTISMTINFVKREDEGDQPTSA
jgi:hypothetical protein